MIAIKRLLLNVIIGITFIAHALLYTFLQTLLIDGYCLCPFLLFSYLLYCIFSDVFCTTKQALQGAIASSY